MTEIVLTILAAFFSDEWGNYILQIQDSALNTVTIAFRWGMIVNKNKVFLLYLDRINLFKFLSTKL